MLSAPTSTPPARSSRSITVASRLAGARSRLILEPASVGSPATLNRFFTANGTPASGPRRRPLARSASSAFARARARASVTAVKALRSPLRFLMAASVASMTAVMLVSPAKIARAISAADANVGSIAMRLRLEHGGRLGVVRQREFGHQRRLAQRDLEIHFNRRQPLRIERKIERKR